MKAVEAVLAHMKRVGQLHVDVPEWLVEDKPLRIFYTPLTVAERTELADHPGPEMDVRILKMKALDEHGKPMFDLDDMIAMRRGGHGMVIGRVAAIIAAAPTPDQAAKN